MHGEHAGAQRDDCAWRRRHNWLRHAVNTGCAALFDSSFCSFVSHFTIAIAGVLGSCIRNVVFDHITFHEPFKAVYIKSNPGDVGVGTVNNITYSNLRVVTRASLLLLLLVFVDFSRVLVRFCLYIL